LVTQEPKFKPNRCAGSWHTHITWDGKTQLFRIKRKQEKLIHAEARYQKRWISNIEFVGLKDAACFEVENSLFLTKDYHVTHNSTTLSWIVLWFTLTHSPALVACTAPTAHQLKDILWTELGAWARRFKEITGQDWFDVKSDELVCKLHDKSRAIARTARRENPEAFQGLHEENMLFIADEASGIEELIFEVGKGALSTEGAMQLLTGNPTKTSGYFFNTFNVNRSRWKNYTVSCLDSTRVSPNFIEECRAEYGEDSNFFKVRVLGEFPTTGSLQFIPTDAVEKCFEFQAPNWQSFPIQFGLDIARHGDDSSVLCIRQGRKVHEIVRYKIDDLTALAGKVAEKAKEWKPEQIAIDVVGMGWGVYDLLAKWKYDPILQDVQAGKKAQEENKYVNVRSEMWDRMKKSIKEGLELVRDEQLKVDLTGIEYDYDTKLRLQLEKKSDMKARGLASPDSAEALALTFAFPIDPDLADKEYVNVVEIGEQDGGYFKGYI
jgi:hypothetical protein